MPPPANAAAPQAADSTHAPHARSRDAAWVIAIVAFALLLRWPGLQAGLHSDDYLQAAMLSGAFPAPRSTLALYDFGGRTEHDAERLRAFGFLPWWSAPELKIAMFRPLSSALIAADDALARRNPALRHLHSAAWFAGLLLGVAALLRAVLPRATALLGLALFAAEPALTLPLVWLPNRVALCACACAVWGLHAYVSFRRHGRTRDAALAALAFVLAVLCGEYALPVLALVIAYEGLLAREPPAKRALCAGYALAPALALVVLGALLGFGTRSSGLYVSPLLEPWRYASASVTRLPALAAELTCAIPVATSLSPNAVLAFASAACAALFVLGLGRWLAISAARELRWLGAGALLGWPLLAGALPEARLLVPIAFAFDALLAALWLALLARARGRAGASGALPSPRARAVAALLALVLALVHLGVKPVRAFYLADAFRARAAAHTRWALAAEVDGAHPRAAQWIVIAARDFTSAEILPFVRAFYGSALPRAYRLLSTAPFEHTLSRPDARTLVLETPGALADSFAGSLQRPRTLPMRAGDHFAAGEIGVWVEAVQDGQPTRMRFVFPKSLDDPEYVFLYPGAGGLRRIALPAVSQQLRLPPPRTPPLRP